jgi:hypothetical protein
MARPDLEEEGFFVQNQHTFFQNHEKYRVKKKIIFRERIALAEVAT